MRTINGNSNSSEMSVLVASLTHSRKVIELWLSEIVTLILGSLPSLLMCSISGNSNATFLSEKPVIINFLQESISHYYCNTVTDKYVEYTCMHYV